MSLDVTLGYPKMVCSQVCRVYRHVMIRRLVRNARKSSNPVLRNLSCSYTHPFAAMRTVRCRVAKYDSAWTNSQEARVTYRDLRSGGARVDQRYSRRIKLFAIVDSAL